MTPPSASDPYNALCGPRSTWTTGRITLDPGGFSIIPGRAEEIGAAAPGATIRKAAVDLKLAEDYRARVRLTGPVPMADEEFGTIKEGALVNSAATILVVLVILWLALRSGRIILAVFLNLFVGLAVTAALGLIVVGALNLISIAFAVLLSPRQVWCSASCSASALLMSLISDPLSGRAGRQP